MSEPLPPNPPHRAQALSAAGFAWMVGATILLVGATLAMVVGNLVPFVLAQFVPSLQSWLWQGVWLWLAVFGLMFGAMWIAAWAVGCLPLRRTRWSIPLMLLFAAIPYALSLLNRFPAAIERALLGVVGGLLVVAATALALVFSLNRPTLAMRMLHVIVTVGLAATCTALVYSGVSQLDYTEVPQNDPVGYDLPDPEGAQAARGQVALALVGASALVAAIAAITGFAGAGVEIAPQNPSAGPGATPPI